MWKCDNCREELKDKYKHCWNCGKPNIEPIKEVVKIIPPKIEQSTKKEIPAESKPAAQAEIPKELELPPKDEPQKTYKPPYEEKFLSRYDSPIEEKSASMIGKIIPMLLWLAAVSAVAFFAYSSSQKTAAFERKIAEEFQNFNNQKSQFVFPPLPPMRRGTVIEGNAKAKVLPLKLKTGETDTLFSYLPDDLRPTNIDEVKTLMWIGCENNAVGKYRDGTTGYQEKCTAYLVERETSKFIGIQEFLGVMPALAKEREGEDAIGKVNPEKYVAYLREKQIEAERGIIQSSSDSPDHHIFTKSEFIYALLLLGLLAAIGFGWLAYNLKFNESSG